MSEEYPSALMVGLHRIHHPGKPIRKYTPACYRYKWQHGFLDMPLSAPNICGALEDEGKSDAPHWGYSRPYLEQATPLYPAEDEYSKRFRKENRHENNFLPGIYAVRPE